MERISFADKLEGHAVCVSLVKDTNPKQSAKREGGLSQSQERIP